MTVEELCEEILAKRREFYSRDLGPWPRNNMVASDIGECAREGVLSITHWKDRPPFEPEVKERLERGNKIEDLELSELQVLGYKVRVERTPFEIKDKKGRIACRGRVDGFLSTNGKDYPFECKSINPNIFHQIIHQSDFDRYLFFRKYPRQLQSYLFANNLEEGFWVLDDCLGHWNLIPCRLDYDRMETILQQLEAVADHVEQKTLPDFHTDPAVCLKCWARGRVCNPPFFAGKGMQVINDPELNQKLNRRAELNPLASEYDHLDKELKKIFEGSMKPEQILIVGPWMIKAKEKTRNFKAQSAKAAYVSIYLTFDIEKIENKSPQGVGS